MTRTENTICTNQISPSFLILCTDVGGGNVSNDTKQSLANIPLRWMVRQVMLSQCGIQFDQTALTRLNIPLMDEMITKEPVPEPVRFVGEKIDPVDLGVKGAKTEVTHKRKEVEKRSVNGQVDVPATPTPVPVPSPTQPSLDQLDSITPLHDALVSQPLWWLLEILPLKYQYQDSKGIWQTSWAWNLGRGRAIVQSGPKFHNTVKDRMEDKELGYAPKARWDKGTEVYVG